MIEDFLDFALRV